jgi:3,4-dihydroxy-2-butanone 4-phosphate synthase
LAVFNIIKNFKKKLKKGRDLIIIGRNSRENETRDNLTKKRKEIGGI